MDYSNMFHARGPGFGVRGHMSGRQRRVAWCHFLIVCRLAANAWMIRHLHHVLPHGFAMDLRLAYEHDSGVLLVRRFSPGGSSGDDWRSPDEFTRAARLLEAAAVGSGHPLCRDRPVRNLRAALERRQLAVRIVL